MRLSSDQSLMPPLHFIKIGVLIDLEQYEMAKVGWSSLPNCDISLICGDFNFWLQNTYPTKGGDMNLTLGGIDLNNSGRYTLFLNFINISGSTCFSYEL